ncbi:MAG TPA: Holliday junction resolvase RuvX [Rhizomicrobium sp.]|nr:Holliday junction resolvase RuvX [Rhizomicrobium sp.]
MAVVAIEALKAALAPGQRLIGLDLGEKTIGIALSDTRLTVATPMETFKRGKFSLDAVKLDAIIAAQGVGGLVVGLPLNMDGSDGPSAQSARAFARNFAARSPALPILMWDERLSTAAVTRTLLDADASRKRRAQVVDKMAAAYILQGALDRLRRLESP